MNPDLQNQTDQIVLWLKVINHTLEQLNLTAMIASTVIVAVLLVIAFRKR